MRRTPPAFAALTALAAAALAALAALTACSSSTSNTGPDPTPDAPGTSPSDALRSDAGAIDAVPVDGTLPTATVVAVTCPATPAKAITASDNNDNTYMPASVTITTGQIVRFTMPSSHDVEPNRTMSDPGLTVGFGETKCLMFTRTGNFGFHCGPHQFVGTVLVQ